MKSQHQEAREKLAVMTLMSALLDAIEAGGENGAPDGILYAGVMGLVTLHQFEQACESLVRHSLVTRTSGPRFLITERGKQTAANLRKALGE